MSQHYYVAHVLYFGLDFIVLIVRTTYWRVIQQIAVSNFELIEDALVVSRSLSHCMLAADPALTEWLSTRRARYNYFIGIGAN